MQINNPEKYEYHEKCRQSSKVYRQSCTEERRVTQQEQTKLRMQAMRERKKLEQEHTEKPRKTRAAQEEQRAKWREHKQEWWGKKTERKKKQKRRRISEACRMRYKEKKLAGMMKASSAIASTKSAPLEVAPSQSHSAESESFQAVSENEAEMLDVNTIKDTRTPAAKRKAVSRTRALLPSSRRQFVRKWNDLILSASPKKQALFSFKLKTAENSLEEQIGKQVLKNLRSLSKKRSKATRDRRSVLMSVCYKYCSLRKSSSLLGVHQKTVSKMEDTGSLSSKMDRKKERNCFFLKLFHVLCLKKKSGFKEDWQVLICSVHAADRLTCEVYRGERQQDQLFALCQVLSLQRSAHASVYIEAMFVRILYKC